MITFTSISAFIAFILLLIVPSVVLSVFVCQNIYDKKMMEEVPDEKRIDVVYITYENSMHGNVTGVYDNLELAEKERDARSDLSCIDRYKIKRMD